MARLSPEIRQALSILYPRLKGVPFVWAITGSVGMALQGMDLPVHDIDLQTDEAGAYAIARLFAEAVTQPVFFRETGRIRSHFGSLEIAGVVVEIMGDLAKRQADGAWGPPAPLAAVRRTVTFEGMLLPVLDLAYEAAAYEAMGRVEKARRIREFIR